jgi:HTH-type transcriptional regulator/antitoxin HigA
MEIDSAKYGELLAKAVPGVIEDPEEHERLLTAAEELMDKGEALSPEERKLLELLVLLVEVFEHQFAEGLDSDEDETADHDPLPLPQETLQRLMGKRGWEPLMLNDIFGNPKVVDEVLAGQRSITKGQARALGKLFAVPPKLFFSE